MNQKNAVSEIEDEFGDAFFTFILLANEYNLDLDKAFERVMKKYEKYIKKSLCILFRLLDAEKPFGFLLNRESGRFSCAQGTILSSSLTSKND